MTWRMEVAVRRRQTVASEGRRDRTITRAPWSPGQFVAILAGLILVILGGVALARAGLDFNNLASTHTQAAGLNHTSLSALIELVAGVILIGGGAYPEASRPTMGFFGVLLLGFGIIVAIQPLSFYRLFGYDHANGIFYAVLGGILLLAAMVSPTIWSRDRQVVSRQTDGETDGVGR